MLSASVFLPPQNAEDGFEKIQRMCTTMKSMICWEDTYIGRYGRNAPRRAPLFAINLWKMYHRTDAELPKTNKSVGGWNCGFQGHL